MIVVHRSEDGSYTVVQGRAQLVATMATLGRARGFDQDGVELSVHEIGNDLVWLTSEGEAELYAQACALLQPFLLKGQVK
jgi:hypothetical protein